MQGQNPMPSPRCRIVKGFLHGRPMPAGLGVFLILFILTAPGCKTTGSATQAPQNPFYGQTTVPPPGTGSYLGQGPQSPSPNAGVNTGGASVYNPSIDPGSSPTTQPPDALLQNGRGGATIYNPGTSTYQSPSSGQWTNPPGTFSGNGTGNAASTWSGNTNTTTPSMPNSSGNYGNYTFPNDRYAPGSTGGAGGENSYNPRNPSQPLRSGGYPSSGGRTFSPPSPNSGLNPSGSPNSFPNGSSGTGTSSGETNPYWNGGNNGAAPTGGYGGTNTGRSQTGADRWQTRGGSTTGTSYEGMTYDNVSRSGGVSGGGAARRGDQVEIPLSARRSTTAEQAHSEFSATFDRDIWETELETELKTASPSSRPSGEASGSFVTASSEQHTVVRAAEPSPVPVGSQPAYAGAANDSLNTSSGMNDTYSPDSRSNRSGTSR
jgi:hypothetical protein